MRQYKIDSPAEINSRQSVNLNYRNTINPLSIVKLKDHFDGKETEIFWLRINEASQGKFSICVYLNVFVDLF